MADFAVAHRPFRQADIEAAGVDQSRRILAHQAIGDGMFGEKNCVGLVPLWKRIFTPTVPNDDNQRADIQTSHDFLSLSTPSSYPKRDIFSRGADTTASESAKGNPTY